MPRKVFRFARRARWVRAAKSWLKRTAMWRSKRNKPLPCTCVISASLADGEQLARKSDYAIRWFERYPDSANLLPISVDAWIFVHNNVNSALTGFRGATRMKVPKHKDASGEPGVVEMRKRLRARLRIVLLRKETCSLRYRACDSIGDLRQPHAPRPLMSPAWLFSCRAEANQCRQNDLRVRRLELPPDFHRSSRCQPGRCGNGEAADPRIIAQTRNAGSTGDTFATGVSFARGIRGRSRHGRRCQFD